MNGQYLMAALFGALVAVASYSARFLTWTGSVATFILAFVIYGTGGWQWTVPIVVFFVLSSLLWKYGKSRKIKFEQSFEKSDTRDWGQVFANGGVAGLVALAAGLLPQYDFYPIYLGALAAVTADTWGTELGVLAGGRTYSVVTLQPVEAGTSGGVSEAGTIAGACGALVIAFAGYPWYTEMRTAVLVVTGGIAGSLVDSLLGGTLQSQFRCTACGSNSERRTHCDQPTILVRGLSWIGNDVVNVCCSLTGAATVWLLLLVF